MPPTTDSDRVVRFEFNGAVYAARPREVTPALARECRTVTGYSPMQLMSLAFDIDVLAAWVWLSRRQAGEQAVRTEGRRTMSLWDEVCSSLTGYDALETVRVVNDEEPIDPET